MKKNHGNFKNSREHIESCLTKLPNGCWEWQSTTSGWQDFDGYAKINYDGKMWLVHRLMYLWHVGPLEDGKVIMHTCDNPPCANPQHLKQGTHAENRRDCVKKGRAANMKGSNNPNAKLTEYQVEAIRGLYAAGLTQAKLCALFNISRRTVYKILNGKSWEEVRELTPTIEGVAELGDTDSKISANELDAVSVQAAKQ